MTNRNTNLFRLLEATSSRQPTSSTSSQNTPEINRGDYEETPETYSLKDMIAEASRNREARQQAARYPHQQPQRNSRHGDPNPKYRQGKDGAKPPLEGPDPVPNHRSLHHLPDHEILALLGQTMGLNGGPIGMGMNTPGFAPMGPGPRMWLGQSIPPHLQPLPATGVNADEIFKNFVAGKAPPKTLQPRPSQNKESKPEASTKAKTRKELVKKTSDTPETRRPKDVTTFDSPEVRHLKAVTVGQQKEIEALRHQLKKCQEELRFFRQNRSPGKSRQEPKPAKQNPKQREVVSDAEEEAHAEYSLAEELKRRLARDSSRDKKRPRLETHVDKVHMEARLMARKLGGREEEPVLVRREVLGGQKPEKPKPRRRSKTMQKHKNRLRVPKAQEQPLKTTLASKDVIEIIDSGVDSDVSAARENNLAANHAKLEIATNTSEVAKAEMVAAEAPAPGENAEEVPPEVVVAEPIEPHRAAAIETTEEVLPQAPIADPTEPSNAKYPAVDTFEELKVTRIEKAEKLPAEVPVVKKIDMNEQAAEPSGPKKGLKKPINVVSPITLCKKQKRLSLQEWKEQRKAAADAIKAKNHTALSTTKEASMSRKSLVSDDYLLV